MKLLNQIILLTLLSSLFFCCNNNKKLQQDKKATNWYKGNLHTHTYWSDGDEFPEVVLNWYKTNNYQFIALSDHNTIAPNSR